MPSNIESYAGILWVGNLLAGMVLGAGLLAFLARRFWCRAADRELSSERGRLLTILNAMPDGVAIINRRHEVDYVNPALREQFGTVDGQKCYQYFSGRKSPCPWCCNQKVFAGESLRWQWTSEKTHRTYEVFDTPFKNEDGSLSKLEFFYDITERRQAEEALRQGNIIIADALQRERDTSMQLEAAMEQLRAATREAQAATQSKSEFLANMSHEIRTPMTAILGFAELMLDPGLSELERLDMAQTIHRNGAHLLGIINNILDLSKIEAGKMTVERVPCIPAQIASEVAELARFKAEAKGLSCQVKCEGTLPEKIATDPIRLRQILMNLFGNAVKFTESGGITLTISYRPGPQPLMQFDVEDTGIGMTPDQAERLFQPFCQADTSMARRFGGTGLGLAISKRLAESLGGTISLVRARQGTGSCFRLTIAADPVPDCPLEPNPSQLGASPAGPHAEAGTSVRRLRCRVLLAEDGPDNRRLISRILAGAGADLSVVDNGASAIEVAIAADRAGRPFNVILMDMQMPVMDGLTATARLREQGYAGAIIALTAHAMSSDRQKCIDAGCTDYAAKPIDRRKLIELIDLYGGVSNDALAGPSGPALVP